MSLFIKLKDFKSAPRSKFSISKWESIWEKEFLTNNLMAVSQELLAQHFQANFRTSQECNVQFQLIFVIQAYFIIQKNVPLLVGKLSFIRGSECLELNELNFRPKIRFPIDKTKSKIVPIR